MIVIVDPIRYAGVVSWLATAVVILVLVVIPVCVAALFWRSRWGALVIAVMLLLIPPTVALGVLFTPLRLMISLPYLDDARCVPSSHPQWIGLYRVIRVDEGPDGICRFTTGGFLDSWGVAKIPGGKPPAPGIVQYHEYWGEWYRFVEE